jgi:nitrogen-specific signal transduction histidine kinase/ActR/RegA family two-component response regulator
MVGSDLRADAAVGGIVLNGRDVTERNDLERRLHHAQRLDAVGHLAGGLAHDFNNMLSAIRGYTELLQADVQPRSPAAVDLASIQAAVDRAAGVTRKLLAFSRKQTVQPVTLNLTEVVHGIEPILRQILGSRITLTTVCPAGLWSVLADPGQIEQVVLNLATNARDAMAEGGTVTLSLVNARGTGHDSSRDEVALRVADTGTGMPPDVRERIFEPFFSTKARDKGMGLGLAMAHGIVTQSGGRIEVDSVEGQGSTFTVFLPRDERAPTVAAPPAIPVVSAGPRRILIVDDEPGVRTVVRRMLRRAGFDVVEADSGPAALAEIRGAAVPFDVLLTDLVMPGMHGRDLIAHARRLVPSLAIVCMTGYASDPDAPDGGPASGLAIVTKPFSAETLLRAVTRTFQGSA